MEAAFPEHFGSWVELRTEAGETRRSDVLDSIGTPARPMDMTAIEDKIAGLLAPLDTAPGIREISHAVDTFDQDGGPTRLLALFAAK